MPTMVDARSTLEKLCDAKAEANADAAGTARYEYEEEADTGEAYGSAKRKAPPLDEDEGAAGTDITLGCGVSEPRPQLSSPLRVPHKQTCSWRYHKRHRGHQFRRCNKEH